MCNAVVVHSGLTLDQHDELDTKKKEIKQRLRFSSLTFLVSVVSMTLRVRDKKIQEELAIPCYAVRNMNPNLDESPFWMWKVIGISIAFVIGIFFRWRIQLPEKKPQSRIQTINWILTGLTLVIFSYRAINGPIILEHARRLLASSKNVEVDGNNWGYGQVMTILLWLLLLCRGVSELFGECIYIKETWIAC
jgi:hypothetical protein